jgi:two-component system response regulator AtoC
MLESTILVISDDPTFIEPIGEIVQSVERLKMVVVPGVDGAYAYDGWEKVALVLIHQRRRGSTGEISRLLQMISAAKRAIATLVIGDHYDSEQALTLLRLGVADYLNWPEDETRLAYLIEVLTIRSRSLTSRTSLQDPRLSAMKADSVDRLSGLDEDFPGTDRLMSQVRRVAAQETTILLSGETGTGKSRLAQMIHELSPRKSEPFVVINCGSISPLLLESEMFGHVRGSVPGSEIDRPGKFAEVGRGTIFLDEIETLPLSLQAKLLRVVEDRQFEPIGTNKVVPLRARLIAASNRSLDEEVANSRFRSDLYYRLNVIGFQLPPLRDRPGAIPCLVAKFLSEFASQRNSEVESISDEALRALEAYDWPGNVRELRNLIERAVTFCQGPEIRVGDLPEAIMRGGMSPIRAAGMVGSLATAAVPSVNRSTLAEIKRDAELARITEALEKHSNNRLRAASELGISRMTLYKKLYKYGLMQHSGTPPRNSMV